jgi:hypothetical protein
LSPIPTSAGIADCAIDLSTHAINIVFPERMVHSRADVMTLLGKVVE